MELVKLGPSGHSLDTLQQEHAYLRREKLTACSASISLFCVSPADCTALTYSCRWYVIDTLPRYRLSPSFFDEPLPSIHAAPVLSLPLPPHCLLPSPHFFLTAMNIV